MLAKTETSLESLPVICKSIELCTLCPWLFPKVIPRMIEPFEFKSPKILERVFFTKTPSSKITLFWVRIKSSVSFEKTSLLIFAAMTESLFTESSGMFGFFHVKIWALIKLNTEKIKKKENIFLAKISAKPLCKSNEKLLLKLLLKS